MGRRYQSQIAIVMEVETAALRQQVTGSTDPEITYREIRRLLAASGSPPLDMKRFRNVRCHVFQSEARSQWSRKLSCRTLRCVRI